MTLQEKYNAINEGAFSKQQFLRDARLAFPQIISQFNSYEDASQILKNRGIIGEAEKKPEPVKFDPADKIAPDVLDQGIKAELEKKGLPVNQSPTSEEYAAAKKKAVANITKDLLYYKNAQTMASSKSEKMEKAKVKLNEIKEGNLGHNEAKARTFMKSVSEVNEDFAKFDNLKMAVVQHEKGVPYYDKTRLINIFNQLDSPDQERAKREYSQYFGKPVKEASNKKPMKPELKESHVRKLAELILEAKLAEEMSVHGELQRILDTDTPKVAQGAAIALEALKKFYAASENLTRKLEKAYKVTGPFMAPALGAAVVKQINDIVAKPYKAEMPKAKMVNIAKINDFETLSKETGISVDDLKAMQRQLKTGITALPTVDESKKRNPKSLLSLLEADSNTPDFLSQPTQRPDGTYDISNVMNVREVGEETYFLNNREVEVLDFGTHDSGNGEHRVALSAKFVDTGEFLDEEDLAQLNQETFESDYVNPFEFGDEDAFDMYEAKKKPSAGLTKKEKSAIVWKAQAAKKKG